MLILQFTPGGKRLVLAWFRYSRYASPSTNCYSVSGGHPTGGWD